MTRIVFDASCTAKRQRTGVGRYAACLLDALVAKLGTPETADLTLTLAYRLSRWRRAPHRYRANHPAVKERWFADRLAAALLGTHDVFHGLDARLPRGWSGPAIATLHDVGAVERTDIASDGFRDKKLVAYRDLAARATKIVCVSEATRDSFRALFPLPLDRFTVIHHGLEPRFRRPSADELESLRVRLELPDRYLFFVGLLSARKNLTTLIDAFSRVAANDPSLWLILAGARAHGVESIDAVIERSPARNRIWLPGYVSDGDLPALYAGAEAFVFPGLVEGFGMPMLEAMACGTPVVAADRPVTREVGGDAAFAVDAADVDELAAGIERVIEDDALRDELRARGFARVRNFTWAAAADRTLDVARSLVPV